MDYRDYLSRHRQFHQDRPKLTHARFQDLQREHADLVQGRRDPRARGRIAELDYFLCRPFSKDPFLAENGEHSEDAEFRSWLCWDHDESWLDGLVWGARLLEGFAWEFVGRPSYELHEREVAFFALLWYPLLGPRVVSPETATKALRERYLFHKAHGRAVSVPKGLTRRAVLERLRDLRLFPGASADPHGAVLAWARTWAFGLETALLIGRPCSRQPDARTADPIALEQWLRDEVLFRLDGRAAMRAEPTEGSGKRFPGAPLQPTGAVAPARRSTADRRPPSAHDTLYTLEFCLTDGPVSEGFIERNPHVVRTIQIRGSQTLDQLHLAVFAAFEREDEHLYEFQVGEGPEDPDLRVYRLPPPAGLPEHTPEPGDASRTKVESLGLTEGQGFGYLFDFGDAWWHQVNVLSIEEAPKGERYPKLIDAVGESPPQYTDEDED